jgi:DNA end-binding protein Ku
MAERLIDDMSMKWEAGEYHDTYRDDLLKLIEEKAAGHVKAAPKSKRVPREAEVIDFAKLLERSLASRKRGPAAASRAAATHRRAA